MSANGKLTKKDVEYLGALKAQIDGLSEELDNLKTRFRDQFGPEVTVEGYAFVVSIGKIGQSKAKVDWRARYVADHDEATALRLEEKTEKEVVGERDPIVTIKINPQVRKNPDLLLKSKEVLEEFNSKL